MKKILPDSESGNFFMKIAFCDLSRVGVVIHKTVDNVDNLSIDFR